MPLPRYLVLIASVLAAAALTVALVAGAAPASALALLVPVALVARLALRRARP